MEETEYVLVWKESLGAHVVAVFVSHEVILGTEK